MLRLSIAAALLPAAAGGAPDARADDAGPATLAVEQRTDLGAAPTAWWHWQRWNHAVTARDGSLLFIHATADRTISCWRTADGRTFAPPVVACRDAGDAEGADLSVAIDADDTLYIAYTTGKYDGKDVRVHVKRLPRHGADAWDVAADATTPFLQFGRLVQRYPSLYIAPGSRRVWCLYSYATGVGTATRPLLTFSDDGGAAWAPPDFVGSDSGDSGTGVRAFRSYRGHPAFFWAFWDCGPPSWGFFDGSRVRPLRELLLHHKRRAACNHPWDALEGDGGRLYFVTGLTWAIDGLLYRWFDGSTWSKEVFLSDRFAQPVLLTDGRHTFCAAAEQYPAKARATRLMLYELNGDRARRLPVLYECPAGRAIARVFSMPTGRRPAGYAPLFLLETDAAAAGETTAARLVYLRLQVKASGAGDTAAGPPLVEPEGYHAPLPLSEADRRALLQDPTYKLYVQKQDQSFPDRRTEPRTDPPKDRRLLRIGDRWVLLYADDNPGRLLAAPIEAGRLGEPVVLIGDRAWGRFQCAAAPDGEDRLDAVCGGAGQVVHVRLSGIRRWADTPPAPGPATVLASGLAAEPWPTICRAGDGRLLVAYVDGPRLRTRTSADGGATWADAGELDAAAADPRPSLLVHQAKPVLLIGHRGGVSCARWTGRGWSAVEQAVGEKWVGAHFSAVSQGDRIDVVCSPADSSLGRPVVLHAACVAGAWSAPTRAADGVRVRGLSLCSLGGGRLLLTYAVRGGREAPADAAAPGDVLAPFTWTLRCRLFDGRSWAAGDGEVPWPELRDDVPADWSEPQGTMGFVIVPAREAGIYPTLPASAAEGGPSVPAAWMVPGFNCVPPYWKSPDRGGLLVVTPIPVTAEQPR